VRTECARRTRGSSAFSPAFSPIAFGCKQACAARSGSPAHRVRPSNLWLACVLTNRVRLQASLRRPLWLACVHLEFQSFPSIVSA